MRVLITGASGQMGSYLSDLYLEEGYEVIGIVRRRANPNNENLETALANPNFKLVEGDITDAASMDYLVREYKPAHFINTAAQSHVHTSFNQPSLTFEVNTLGVLNCLESIRKFSPSTRFLQYSTSEMFGSNSNLFKDLDIDRLIPYQDETTLFHPRSPYGCSKVAAFHLIQNYRESYGLFAANIIMFNCESPRRGDNFVTRKITKHIGKLVKNCTTGRAEQGWGWDSKALIEHPKLALGNLDAVRDWGFAGDYVKAAKAILDHTKADDFIVCTGEAHSIREFLDEAFSYVGISKWNQYVYIDPQFFRPADVEYLNGRADKIKRELGWESQVKFKELVRLMIDAEVERVAKT